MSEFSEIPIAPKPEFDGGSFTISQLSTSPEGFEFKSRNSISRKQDPLNLNPDQHERLKKSVQGEMKYHGVETLRDAKSSYEENPNDPDLEENYREAKQKYIKGMVGKIGIRNLKREGNMLSGDVKLVSFPVYVELANPGNSPEILDFSENSAVAMAVRSSDGRLIIQHRAIEHQKLHEDKPTRGNIQYSDIPGASAAGVMDASIESEDRNKGTPDPVDTDSIKNAILKEAGEELGIGIEDFKSVRIVGVAHDRVKIHDEILWFGESNLTADQIRQTSKTSNRNKNLADHDFEEKFVDIDGSPESIEKLLTEVKSPLPPTHSAAFVAAGFSLVLKEQGIEAANLWKQKVEKGVRENYRRMDEIVTEYYNKHPEALAQVPERFWGKNIPPRNLRGYTPFYGPQEQGLPSFEDEMTRTGLIPETRREVESAYLFDIDGVLTDPVEKRVVEEGLYGEIIKRLQKGEPVGLITGRSNVFMLDRIINPLRERVSDVSILQNLAAVGEKGGTWITFDENGVPQEGKSKDLSIPEELKERVRRLIAEKYSDSMFFDETKQTMLSTEMIDGYDLADYHMKQKELEDDMRMILDEFSGDLNIDPTTIATDIENPHVGKGLAAERFLQFIRDRDIKPGRFIAFGDSKSDFEMADELERRGKKLEMVYVGHRDKMGDQRKEYPVNLDYADKFTQGTLEYLLRAD